MKRKNLLKLIVGVSLAAVMAISIPLMSGCAAPGPAPTPELEPVKIGYIGFFASDIGKNTERAAEIFIDEVNAAGGVLGGRPVVLVKADTGQDVEEGIKAYEYLVEVGHVDMVISGCVDDVTLGWLPRCAEYRMPTVDTWTSAILAIDEVERDYERFKPYFMTCMDDYFLGQGMVHFARDFLNPVMGWDTMVLLNEDTAYGVGTAELVLDAISPQAGIAVLDHIVYDIETIDFAPIFARCEAANPDFIYHISSVNTIIPVSQYVESMVPLPITGIAVEAMGEQFWDDTGGMAAGYSTCHPHMGIGLQGNCDPRTQAFIDTWKARYGDSRPTGPIFSGYSTYYGLYQAFNSAEYVYEQGLGSGFEPLDAWVEAMEGEPGEITLMKDGEVFAKWDFYGPGVYEPVTGRNHPHNLVFDPLGESGTGLPGIMVTQWHEGGMYDCIFPPKYATGEFEMPWWIEE